MLSLLLDTYHKTYLAIRNILPTVMTPDSLWAKQNGLGAHYICVYVHKQSKSTDITVIRVNITHVYLCRNSLTFIQWVWQSSLFCSLKSNHQILMLSDKVC